MADAGSRQDERQSSRRGGTEWFLCLTQEEYTDLVETEVSVSTSTGE